MRRTHNQFTEIGVRVMQQIIPFLQFSIKGKVFEIRLNRPAKFNALTLDMYNGITEALYFASNNKETSVTVMSCESVRDC